jgi:hypothetical protein
MEYDRLQFTMSSGDTWFDSVLDLAMVHIQNTTNQGISHNLPHGSVFLEILIVMIMSDRLCSLVVRVSGY